ncbi:hypothetical protein [Streptomyces noursei]|uniref:hypothetical protein n=1 Tax=Streptomyces noursei TaxID=1971 RepID=UPI0019635CD4|nr:hypothetical protein [Streptomyces noursei]QRX95333.1 hypothetical protein JNO44_35060 [Streptomyces noursei]
MVGGVAEDAVGVLDDAAHVFAEADDLVVDGRRQPPDTHDARPPGGTRQEVFGSGNASATKAGTAVSGIYNSTSVQLPTS